MNEGKNSGRSKIIFEPMKFGVAWHVRAIHPSNQVVEHITGFASEAAAKEWIDSDDAEAWLRSREQAVRDNHD
jgi:antibiotic biosynthesis monooxygenase (ABM) superfamily enzyme